MCGRISKEGGIESTFWQNNGPVFTLFVITWRLWFFWCFRAFFLLAGEGGGVGEVVGTGDFGLLLCWRFVDCCL
ncbi:unnamed protein product [Sphagnum balticum]